LSKEELQILNYPAGIGGKPVLNQDTSRGIFWNKRNNKMHGQEILLEQNQRNSYLVRLRGRSRSADPVGYGG